MRKYILIATLLLLSSLFGEYFPADMSGAVGAWELSEYNLISTDEITDLSGNGNVATSANAPSFTADQNGVPEQAMSFNGSSDRLTISDADNLDGMDELTISFWIYPLDGGDGNHWVVSKNYATSYSVNYRNADDAYFFYINNVALLCSANSVTYNEWQHIVATYNSAGTGTATIYKNGVKIKEDTTFVGNPVGSDASDVMISTNSNDVYGTISHVAIYSEAKSATWVSSQYTAGLVTANMVIDATDSTTATFTDPLAGAEFYMPMHTPYTQKGADITITDIDGDGTTADCDAVGHGLEVGSILKITGSTSYDGKHVILTVPTEDTFTFPTDQSTTNETGTGNELNAVTTDLSAYSNDGTVSGATLQRDGLVNATAGIAYIPSSTATGVWEFDVQKNLTTNEEHIGLIADGVGSYNQYSGYYVLLRNTGTNYTIRLQKNTNGSGANVLFESSNGYIANATKYRIRFERNSAYHFTGYIMGGAYGWDDWTLIDDSGVASTTSNPTTSGDTDYTTSSYFLADIDAGDTISDLHINGQPISLSDANISTGTWTTTKPSYSFTSPSFVDVGDTGRTCNTVGFWCYPTDVTSNAIIDFDGSDYSLAIGCGTLRTDLIDTPTIYIDGVLNSTVTINTWQYIMVTTATGFTVDNFDIGRVGADYFEGRLAEFSFWSYEMTDAAERSYAYNRFKGTYK